MSPFDELSNNDNTSSADDIVSESSGFKTSPVDDLFDIIEPSEPVEEKKDDSDFVQDEDFLNSLDFINGFSDIDENEATAVEANDMTGQAVGNLDLNDILNETAPEIPDISDNLIADIPGVADVPIADMPIADMPIADAPIADVPVADVPIADMPISDVPVQEMISDYPATAEMPAEFTAPEESSNFDMNAGMVADMGTPVADVPIADMPIADVPVADVPIADMPITDMPVADVPVADVPAQETFTDYAAAAVMPADSGMTDIPQEDESADAVTEEDEEESDEDYYDDIEDESMMIVTEGTTITGSIGTNTSMLILGSVNGDITCEGKLTISGKVIGNSFAMDVFVNSPRVEGNIGCTGTLKISQGTVVIGDISAGAAAIAGAVKGNLDITGPVILDSTAVIKGNIKAKSVQLINGAVLEGFCTLEYSDSQLDEIFANDAG